MPPPSPEPETRAGAAGAVPAFPSTCWSRILGGGPSGRDLEALARSYWRPVYGFIRARGKRAEDAKDACQEFFAWLIERDVLDRADPARGRFRAFLKTALQRFLIGIDRRERAQKRGGGSTVVRLDVRDEDLPDLGVPDLRDRPPEEVLERLWRTALVERALDALEQELKAQGKSRAFAIFRDYFLDPGDDSDYGALAQRHGVSNAQVSNDLQLAKKRYRALLHAAVQETVSDPVELEGELRWLFGADA